MEITKQKHSLSKNIKQNNQDFSGLSVHVPVTIHAGPGDGHVHT